MSFYDFIYKLKPAYEDIKDGGVGWYKLEWKPIKMGTWNFYIFSGHKLWSFDIWESNAHNGWNRYWDGLHIRLGLYFIEINFWVRWNICVHKDGPADASIKRPLDLSRLKEA
jgi:hypothetical protein